MRRARIAFAAALVLSGTSAVTLTSPPATAAPAVVAAAALRFVPAEVTMTKGGTLTFANTDVAPHDVTSDQFKPNGSRLFSSATIPTGQAAPVNGVKALDEGVYSFFCTIHPEMRGLLDVEPNVLPVEDPKPPPVSVPLGIGVPTPTSITWFGNSLYAASWAQGSVMRMRHLGGGVLGTPTTYATGFDSPLGIAFGPDGTLYVSDSYSSARPGRSTDGRVWAVAPGGGNTATAGSVVVSALPNGRHNTNGLAVRNGRLYITNGNSTDDGVAGGDPEEPLSGTLVSVPLSARGLTPSAHGGQLVVEAKGMRNDYDVAFRPGTAEAWMTVNGLDAQAPWGEDSLVRDRVVGDGIVSDFGFPGCVHRRNAAGVIKRSQNPAVVGIDTCGSPASVEPEQLLGLHVSADGLAFGPNDSYWGGDLFVAEFGSFNGTEGHKVVRVPIDGAGNASPPVDFAVAAAPLDLAFGPAGTGLYVADFAAGQILLFAKPPA